MIKISIIIPVYNTEMFIQESISSVLNQSLADIELICIDDASTDKSYEILLDNAKKDDRITIIRNTERRGAFQARNEGIRQAKGKYILFLDADDSLESGACQDLYHIITSKKVEILHFQVDVVDYGAGKTRTDNMRKFVLPYKKRLYGDEILTKCFRDKKYRFNLWNKVFSAELCKRALVHIDEEYYPKANDLYLYFILSLYAESYLGIASKRYYKYCFGRGSTGNRTINISQFENYCQEAKVVEAIKKLLIQSKKEKKYKDILDTIHWDLLKECINNWYLYLDHNQSAEGYDLLIKYWGVVDTVVGFSKLLNNDVGTVAAKIDGAKSISTNGKRIKTIGIFYYRMARGGVQRVISLLLPIYLSLGYKIVLFTDEVDLESDYDIPSEIKRVKLPTSIGGIEYEKRAPIFQKELEDNNIDLLFYHAAVAKDLLYEVLLTKTLGIPFVLTVHEMFSQSMVDSNLQIIARPYIYKLIDKVTVLSNTEKIYWNTFGIEAVYIPNPFDEFQVQEKEKDYILWIGRLEIRQKQYLHAIRIMREVVKFIPDAKMKLVGHEVTPGSMKSVMHEIKKWDLGNNIEVCKFQKNVNEFYERAKIHLLTSAFESFPMTIIESKSYGVPMILYDMPYLEILRGGKGYIAVKQDDIRGAALNVVELLSNEGKRSELGREALESIEGFKKQDLSILWQDVISQIAKGKEQSSLPFDELDKTEEPYKTILSTMLFHFGKSCEYREWVLNNTVDYKIGKLLLFIPRKIKRFLSKVRRGN